MDDKSLNTFSLFNMNGKDMRYQALDKRVQMAAYRNDKKNIYNKELELYKKSINELKKDYITAGSLSLAAVICNILLKIRQKNSKAASLLNILTAGFLIKTTNDGVNNLFFKKSLFRQSKDYEKTLNFDESFSPKIAVIDEFRNKILKIDWDNKPDMVHGEAVKVFIKSKLPNADISKFDTNLSEKSVKEAVESILNGDKKYDAINLSKSSDMKFKDLSEIVGFKVTAESVAKDKKLIKEKFFDSNYKEVKDLKDIIEGLERLSDCGTKVYISAGNKGSRVINLYTLANNVNVVGAADRYGLQKARFTSDNSLVNRWNKGIFYIKKLKDQNGKIGFDINEDGEIDICAEETTAKFKFPALKIFGTSFAAPCALVEDFRKIKDE